MPRATVSTYTKEQIEACRSDLTRAHYAILMAEFGKDYATVAQTLNLPLGTVKSRLNRARKRLVAALEKAREARAA